MPDKSIRVSRAAFLRRGARLAVMLELADQGQLEGRSLREIADAIGVHRTTVMRDLDLLPELADERDKIRLRMQTSRGAER